MKLASEFSGETCAENVLVDRGKQCEIRQLREISTVVGMNSRYDSVSEKAVGKASSRTSDVSTPDDNLVHSKFEGWRVLERHDDCLSCVSGTDEHATEKSDIEDARIKYSRQSKFSGESPDMVPSSGSPTGLSLQNSGFVEGPPSKSTGDVPELLEVQNSFSEASNGKHVSYDPDSMDIEDDKPFETKGELLEGSTQHLNSLLTAEVAASVGCGDPPAPDLNPMEKNDEMEEEIHPIDETDDSDMVEHDVKVCDICGDAGREELLAICRRCSDGAEHTYCMREMLDKVPEGDWMCEECKSLVRVRNERPGKIVRVDENEKNNSSGQGSSECVNSSDIEEHIAKYNVKIPGKRLREDADAEVSSIVKKPALESIVGSRRTSNSSKRAGLSCGNSLKNVDKGRVQLPHHSSFDTVPVNDTPESARTALNLRGQDFRGTFSKSNSFNSLNSKTKVKLVDQVVLRRQKSAMEHASFHLKEGISRSIGKSLSFKSTHSGRSESKMKTLSPRLSHIQDIKNTKQRNSFERQSSLKFEHPSNTSTMGTSVSSTSRFDKKSACGGQLSSLTAITNHHEVKPVKTEGEFKRPSMRGNSALGVSSANGVNTVQKSNPTSPKEDSSSCSAVAERPPSNEGLSDGLSRRRDFSNSGDRMREYSGSRFRSPSARSSKDETNILKAAIEAAVLRNPGMYRKHSAFGQSDNASVSSMGYEIASCQDHISSSAGKKNLSSEAELPERHIVSQHLKADFLKQETLNNVKQFSLVPVEGLSSGGGDAVPVVQLDEKSSLRDMFINVPAAMPFFSKSVPIPEHEYIWQGSFEICQGGKIVDLWDGIQAHMSMCASPKVVETVTKFKSTIVLYEVPRLSTWPIQFQEDGVTEDKIALFFFAKDLESYDKIYKVLLDNMMKDDLALKGNVNGVELLIFPSNQLPDDSQRWNMLFFLWGVFRGKKESCLQHMPESLEQLSAPRNIPPAIVCLPENRCSLRPITKEFPASDPATPVPKMLAAEELCSLLSSKAVNGDCISKISSLDIPDSRLNSSSSVPVQNDGVKQCQEMSDTCLEGGISSSCRPPLQAARSADSSGREQMLMQFDTPLDRQQSSLHLNKSAAGNHDMEGIGERIILDRRTSNQDQVKSNLDAAEPLAYRETPLVKDRDIKDLNMEHNRWILNDEERLYPESCVVPQTLNPGTSQVLPGNDDDTRDEPSGALEKINHEATGSCDETLIPDHNENGNIHLFPIETPMKGTYLVDRSRPWRMHPLEQNKLHDIAPNLELALGAEIKPLTQGFRPLLVGEVDKNTNEDHIVCKTGTKAEDDVSASLSLSLSFSFPEKEQSTKSAPKTEHLVSEREHVNAPMLLFGGLRET